MAGICEVKLKNPIVKNRIAAKDHKCAYDGGTIPAGSKYISVAYLINGKWTNLKFHPGCLDKSKVEGVRMKRKNSERFWTISLDNGNMSIVKANDYASAEKRAESDIRAFYPERFNRPVVRSIKISTDDDISWFKGMGGEISNPDFGVQPLVYDINHMNPKKLKRGAAMKNQGFKVRMNPYILIKGEKNSNWREQGKLMYQGQTRSIRDLVLPTIEDAHKVAKIAGLDSYMITDPDDNWGSNAVFKTKDILEYEARQLIERSETKHKDLATVEQIKKSKKTIVLRQYPDKTVLFVMRSDPDYRPGYHHGVKAYSTLFLKIKGYKLQRIDYKDYFKSNGTFEKKKFLDRYAWMFGGSSSERAVPSRWNRYNRTMSSGRPAKAGVYPATLQKIAEEMPAIVKEIDKIKRENWEGKVSNPGEAWHKKMSGYSKEELDKARGPELKNYYRGRVDAHNFSALISKYDKLPNPKKPKTVKSQVKKSGSGLLVIAVIAGLVYLVKKNQIV